MVSDGFRIKMRNVTGSHVNEVFVMVDCPKCGSTFTCGEWMTNTREARDLATGGLAEHAAKYPNCKRPVFA